MTVYLIDGHSQAYRAIYANAPDLTSPEGLPTKGPYLFTSMLLKLVREHKPSHLAVAFESPRHTLQRRQWLPSYKSKRPDRDPKGSVATQLRLIRRIVTALSIPTWKAHGWEADDVLASMASVYREQYKVVIVTRDKDLHQCVRSDVVLYDPQTETWTDSEDVQRRWKVAPWMIPDVMALQGDPTDGVPGVKGIGPKRARELIREHRCVEHVIESMEDLPVSIQEAMGQTDVYAMRQLVLLRTDLNVPKAASIRFKQLDLKRARPLFERLGFRRWAESS